MLAGRGRGHRAPRQPWYAVLKLLAFVLPLGIDSFAVAAAIGAAQASTGWQRLRISLVFVIFEGGMPLIGLGLGAALAHGIGQVADDVAAAAVIGVGLWMLLAGRRWRGRQGDPHHHQPRAGPRRTRDQHQPRRAGHRVQHRPVPPAGDRVIVAIALQAFIAAQLGLALGAPIAERWRERAERLAGLALILLGSYLIVEQVTR